jgi:hypothetical protein
MTPQRFISELGARYEYGWSDNGWQRFVEAAGLTLFVLPGGARAVERKALTAAIEKLAVAMPPHSSEWNTVMRKSR